MLDVVKLLIPMFLVAKSYELMLQKLASFAFWQIWLITWILRHVNKIDNMFNYIEISIIPKAVTVNYPMVLSANISGMFLAAIIATLTYIFHLHDKVSNLLGIRSQFDYANILLPLAIISGSSMAMNNLDEIRAQRHSIMRRVFYKYASSTNSSTLVEQHDIHHALNAWSWFWLGVEGCTYWIIAFLICATFSAWKVAVLCAIISLLLSAIAIALQPSLRRRAKAQVETIAANNNAVNEIRQVFDAL